MNPETKIYQEYKKYISNQREVTSYFPSKYGKECERELYYHQANYKQDLELPFRIYMLGRIGTGIHNAIADMFKEFGIFEGQEIKVIDEVNNISGRIDIRIKVGSISLVEIKSVKSANFYYVTQEPNRKDIIQLNIYLHEQKMQTGWLVYINRDDGNWKWHKITYDPDLYKETITKMNYIRDCVAEKKIPDKRFEKENFNCQYCNWKFTCWGAQEWITHYGERLKTKMKKKQEEMVKHLLEEAIKFKEGVKE